MADFDRAYRALADEADTVHLAPPTEVRARADRRTRMRVVAAVAAAAVAVGGATGGTQWLLRADSGPPVTPGDTPTATLSPTPPPATPPTQAASPSASAPASGVVDPQASASATGRAIPRSIPDSAFLQDGMIDGLLGDEHLPELCGATYKSEAKIQVRRSKHVTYYINPTEGSTPEGTFNETITVYKASAAKEFMAQLRSVVAGCARDGDDRYKMVSATKRGDDSFMFEKRYPTVDPDGNPTGGDDVRLISVVRVGDVVMVLYERGWEAGWSADPDVVGRYTATALTRLNSWLGGR
ncbi:hypothetical protein [Micromonospora sp. CPCC 206061]|uniref:hypothetical protein n=1 Tax=Micromonospora sp. CPCC 206061 TaxID=3122410 RepID=UPI002FEF02B5